jgi:hypothetical protein
VGVGDYFRRLTPFCFPTDLLRCPLDSGRPHSVVLAASLEISVLQVALQSYNKVFCFLSVLSITSWGYIHPGWSSIMSSLLTASQGALWQHLKAVSSVDINVRMRSLGPHRCHDPSTVRTKLYDTRYSKVLPTEAVYGIGWVRCA